MSVFKKSCDEIMVTQLYSSKVVLKNTAEAVIVPLKGGISTLNEVYEALIKADVDPVTEQCSNYDYIRQKIVQAHQLLKQSEQTASSGLKCLDESLERLTQDEGKLKSSAMLIGGGIEIHQAGNAIIEAEEEVKKSDAEVNQYECKVSDYESKISQTKRDISEKDDKLKQKCEEIQKVKKQCKSVADFQKKVRSAVHLLDVLSGRASVTEHQTRRFILQEPVMKVMEDVMKATEEITGNKVLYNNGMPKLLKQLKKNSKRLAAICASEDSSEMNTTKCWFCF
ncbi:hypothetical protein AMELA_G00175700 [Ameiurus melas]|uniref:Uncharacterized protein n=1 Tax=Ameiurus melas TaxID=219545 RepID=A0A7J6ADA7_AMEME|nr:hypothetical protein AMELA_G00175700 [Ameiurus melas]